MVSGLFRSHRTGSASRDPDFFLQFSSEGQTLGQVVIKISSHTGKLGREFASLLTGERGFGYRGSRVYACCRDSWCLLGDVLYRPLQFLEDSEEHRHVQPSRGPCLGVAYPDYKGYELACVKGESVHTSEKKGNLVVLASDFDLAKGAWTLGPAFKVALVDNPTASGRVVGCVVSGLEVLQELSRRVGEGVYEPSHRITISECGEIIN